MIDGPVLGGADRSTPRAEDGARVTARFAPLTQWQGKTSWVHLRPPESSEACPNEMVVALDDITSLFNRLDYG